MKQPNNNKNHKEGVSLYEVTVTLGIFILISIVIFSFILQSYKSNRFIDEQSTAINETKKGVDTMVSEIREASSGENGDYPIKSANIQSFTFYGDIDVDDVVEQVSYFLVGSDLQKGVIEPTNDPIPLYKQEDMTVITLSKYVRNTSTEPIFTYYNGDWPGDTVNNPLVTPSDPDTVKLINVFLRVNFNPIVAPKDFVLDSNVQIRSLKENL